MRRNGILLPKLFWPTVRKKLFLWSRKTFEIESEGQEFAKTLQSLEQFVRTVKGQKNACSWRFLRFDRTIRIQISKNYLDSDTCRKSLKNNFSFLFEVHTYNSKFTAHILQKKTRPKKAFKKIGIAKRLFYHTYFLSLIVLQPLKVPGLQPFNAKSLHQKIKIHNITMWANFSEGPFLFLMHLQFQFTPYLLQFCNQFKFCF